ncbi:MAG: helix-turn-helix domain-containing protein [Patulibacter sp.]
MPPSDMIPDSVPGQLPTGTLLARLRTLHADALDAVITGEPLERLAGLGADATGAPVGIVVSRQCSAFSSSCSESLGKSVVRYVDERLRGRLASRPNAVVQEATIERQDQAIGAVLLLGEPDSEELAREALHLLAGCMLSYLSNAELRAKLEDAVGGSLIAQLRAPERADEQSLRWRAAQAGADLSEGGVAICVHPRHGPASHAVALVGNEIPGAIAEEIDGKIYAIVATTGAASSPAWARIQRLAVRLRTYGHVGTSGHYNSILELRHAMDEADLLADVGREAPDASSPDPAPQGTYHLLFRLATSHPEELETLYRSTVGPLVEYDDIHQTDLLKTLTTYLAHDGNMNATASSLFAHRHTVAYRIDRIREICELDPARSEHRERLGIGIKAHRILAR